MGNCIRKQKSWTWGVEVLLQQIPANREAAWEPGNGWRNWGTMNVWSLCCPDYKSENKVWAWWFPTSSLTAAIRLWSSQVFSSSVCLSLSKFPLLIRTPWFQIPVHPNDLILLIPKAWFLNEVTFTCVRGLELDIFWGGRREPSSTHGSGYHA